MKAKIHITATFNNTLINFTDLKGNTLCCGSTGTVGFKGARKSTPFAAATLIETISKKAVALGVDETEVYIKGPGPGRDAVLRVLRNLGIRINLIADITPIPHNGPRAKKRRRI